MGRPSAITSLKDAPSQGNMNWLIYGKAGDGKTVLAGTAPNALFLTVEAAGTESAKAMGSTADEWVIPRQSDLDKAYEYFKNGSGCKDFDWVLMDSISEVEDVFWREVQGTGTTKKIQDYGTVETMMRREVDRWNRLPINVLYTAQTMRLDVEGEDADDEDVTLLLPSMGTKNGVLAQRICAKTTLNGLLVVRSREVEGKYEERRLLHLRGSQRWVAKDRHMLLQSIGDPNKGYLVDPTVAEMAAAAADLSKNEGSPKKKAKKAKTEGDA